MRKPRAANDINSSADANVKRYCLFMYSMQLRNICQLWRNENCGESELRLDGVG